jgi:hypothetical protein
MPQVPELLLGEFPRMLDERYRLTLPGELTTAFLGSSQNADCILAKERPAA